MGSTAPLWITAALAVLTVTLPLAGVFWTQRAADRRAEREAVLRLQHEQQVVRTAQLHALYEEIITTCQAMLRDGSAPALYFPLYTRALLIAPDAVEAALLDFWTALLQYEDPDRTRVRKTEAVEVGERMVGVIEAIRTEVHRPVPAPPSRIDRTSATNTPKTA